MTTVIIPKKEYEELLKIKEKLDQILKKVSIKEKRVLKGTDLFGLTKLKIRGGPKDLSEKVNSYLYEK
jgi:NifU-like protein involved in Fe-S cluster formation